MLCEGHLHCQIHFKLFFLYTCLKHKFDTYQTLSIFDRNIKQSSVKLVFEAIAQFKSEASKKKKKFDRVNGHQYMGGGEGGGGREGGERGTYFSPPPPTQKNCERPPSPKKKM